MKTMKRSYLVIGALMLLFATNSAFAQNKAYGNNMVRVDSIAGVPVYAIYSGDMNQDGNVALDDFSLWDFDNANFAFGYNPTDLNGDGNTALDDFSIWDANNANFVGIARPF